MKNLIVFYHFFSFFLSDFEHMKDNLLEKNTNYRNFINPDAFEDKVKQFYSTYLSLLELLFRNYDMNIILNENFTDGTPFITKIDFEKGLIVNDIKDCHISNLHQILVENLRKENAKEEYKILFSKTVDMPYKIQKEIDTIHAIITKLVIYS